jgi:multidrug efflux pump subunit AcrA (membrane-fusion protein)
VVEGDGSTATVRERRVETGLAFDGRVAISSGLDAGTRVVVEGNESLQQGQQVSIRGER